MTLQEWIVGLSDGGRCDTKLKRVERYAILFLSGFQACRCSYQPCIASKTEEGRRWADAKTCDVDALSKQALPAGAGSHSRCALPRSGAACLLMRALCAVSRITTDDVALTALPHHRDDETAWTNLRRTRTTFTANPQLHHHSSTRPRRHAESSACRAQQSRWRRWRTTRSWRRSARVC